MSIAVISDIHIVKNEDNACQLFTRFCSHKKVLESTSVVLLGDIFDIMIGNHNGYSTLYPKFFKNVGMLLSRNIKVYYVEGNHDFHICNLLNNYYGEFDNFNATNSRIDLLDEGKNICLSHGDELETEDFTYIFYRKIIRSLPLRLIADKILSFETIQKIGFSHSNTDKKILNYKNVNKDSEKKKFRSIAKKFFLNNPGFDYLVCGHSHVQDRYEFGDKIYLNNGFPLGDRTFLSIDGEDISFNQI